MTIKKLSVVITFMILLIGCNNNNELSVELKSLEITVNSFESTCSLVESVNGNKTVSVDEESNTLVVGDDLISCSKVDSSKLGETMIEFSKGDSKAYSTINIVDLIPPTISTEDNVVVEQGNNYFNLKSLIAVKDNYDTDPSVEYEGTVDINKVGTYKVKVVAKDSSNNISEETINVEVIEKEKEIVIVEVPPANSNNTKPNNPSKPQGDNNNKPSQPTQPNKPSIQKPNDKFFMYSDGYNMDTGYKACVEYITIASKNGFGGTCSSVDQNGISKGYKATIN